MAMQSIRGVICGPEGVFRHTDQRGLYGFLVTLGGF